MPTTAKLGREFIAAEGSVTWKIQSGVQPYTTVLVFNMKQREALVSMLGTAQVLEIKAPESSVALQIQGVWVLQEVQASAPHLCAFLVADRRWKWMRPLVVRDYNMPRKTGDRTLVGPNEERVPVELAASIDKFRYAPYSLKNETKRWNARQLLEDVLEEVDPGSWRIESMPVVGDGEAGQVSIQGLMLRDSGTAAIARALGKIPGASVRVDEDSKVVVFDATDTAAAAKALKDNGWSPTVRGEIARWCDRWPTRPKIIYVYFQREIELRFDFDESIATRYAHDNSLFAENVAPIPEPTLTVNGQVLGQGTMVPIVDLLAAWDASSDIVPGTKIKSYSLATVRDHFLRGDLEAVWGALGQDQSTTGNVYARAATIYQHWRQTFRISRRYAERLRELRNVRVAVLDKATGQRAPAMAWSQYCIVPSQKALAIVSRRDPQAQLYWINKDDYPGENAEVTDKPCSAARVEVIDPVLGVIRVHYPVGPFGLQESIKPCMTSDANGSAKVPTRNYTQALLRPIAVGGALTEGSPIRCADTFKIAFIVSGVAAAPNNKRQLHRETVTQGDLGSVLRTKYAAGTANGPDWHVFVPPQGGATARFGWKNTAPARETAQKLLGLNSTDPTKSGVNPGDSLAGFLFVNGDDEIKANARAEAARIWAAFVDGVEGKHSSRLHRFPMVGNVEDVTYDLAPDGRLSVDVGFSGARPEVDPYALLPESVRQMTLRIIRGDDAK